MERDVPRGVDNVCFDASPLIHFCDAGALAELNGWFVHGSCFTAAVIKDVELAGHVDRFPRNQEIIDAPWLQAVPVQEDDFRFIATLRRLWGSADGRDFGEAEVVALCRRYDWIAVMNDGRGRAAARDYDVPVVSTAGLVVGAAADGAIAIADAWSLHQRVEGDFERPMILPTTAEYRQAFEQSVRAVQRWISMNQSTTWPGTLAMTPPIDGIIGRAVARLRS